jgi:hypothetical protein
MPRQSSKLIELTDIMEITNELGVLWGKDKTIDFKSEVVYNGYLWNIKSKRVSLPIPKIEKYLVALSGWETGSKRSIGDARSLAGKLNHTAFVLPLRRSKIVAINNFISTFRNADNNFITRSVPKKVIDDIGWWKTTLNSGEVGRMIKVRGDTSDVTIWVDASTSWGIGVIIGSKAASWKWSSEVTGDYAQISFGEMVAIEVMLYGLVALGLTSTRFRIFSDNQAVIGALNAGRYRNQTINQALQRIISTQIINDIDFDFVYVQSASNLADGLSRGLVEGSLSSLPAFELPGMLKELLIRSDI